jgi:hypothetical protein
MILLAACEDPDAPEARSEPNGAEIDRLVALGYLDHAEESADPRQMRVVEIDRERSQPGYRLYCTNRTAIAELIDVEGRPVHSWSAPDTREFMACLLLDDGDIVIVGVLRPTDGSDDSVDSDRYLARYAWDGRMKWRRAIPVHHHVSLTPDGKLASLGLRYREIPEVDATVAVRDDEMLLLDPDGHVIEERSIYDALASAAGQDRFLPIQARKKWGVDHVDLIHANTIEWMRHEHLVARSPLYAPGNVLVTLRHQNGRMAHFNEDHPLASGAVGFALGAVIGSVTPLSRVEHDALKKLADAGLARGASVAEEAARFMTGAASDIGERPEAAE